MPSFRACFDYLQGVLVIKGTEKRGRMNNAFKDGRQKAEKEKNKELSYR